MSYDRIYNLMTSEELEKLSIIETEKLRSLRSEAAKVAELKSAIGCLENRIKDIEADREQLQPLADAWRAVRAKLKEVLPFNEGLELEHTNKLIILSCEIINHEHRIDELMEVKHE